MSAHIQPFRIIECPNIKIKTENKSINGSGKIYLTKNSRLTAELVLNDHLIHYDKIDAISGQTKEGYNVSLINPFITQIINIANNPIPFIISKASIERNCNFKPDTYVYYLKNCKVNFQATINYKNEKITLSGINSKKDDQKGKIGGCISIKGTKLTEKVVDDLVDDICKILSIIQRIPIRISYLEKYCGEEFIRAEAYRSVDDHEVVIPMVQRFAKDISKLVAIMLPRYLKNKSDYNLNILTHYYCSAYTALFDEHKYIFGSIFMEALKYNWAKNVSNLDNNIDNKTGVIKGFLKPGLKKELSFKELMNLVAIHLGYSANTFSFIDNRNMLFHTGIPTAAHTGHDNPNSMLWDELLTLYDQMDDLLLTILGFTGEIYSMRYTNSLRKVPKQ